MSRRAGLVLVMCGPTSAIPTAMSKLVANSSALGREDAVGKVLDNSRSCRNVRFVQRYSEARVRQKRTSCRAGDFCCWLL